MVVSSCVMMVVFLQSRLLKSVETAYWCIWGAATVPDSIQIWDEVVSQNMWSMCGQSQINKQFKGSLGYNVAIHTVLFMFLNRNVYLLQCFLRFRYSLWCWLLLLWGRTLWLKHKRMIRINIRFVDECICTIPASSFKACFLSQLISWLWQTHTQMCKLLCLNTFTSYLMPPPELRWRGCRWSWWAWRGNWRVEQFSQAGVRVMRSDFVLSAFPS